MEATKELLPSISEGYEKVGIGCQTYQWGMRKSGDRVLKNI
jgi:hypothetical protein